jgi:hypothetical protein
VSLARPTVADLGGWLTGLAVALILLEVHARRRMPALSWALFLLLLASLFAGTRRLPYNHPTAADAFLAWRPPIARLSAQADCARGTGPCHLPPGRLLGLSDIFFDVGDQAELDTIYSGRLPADARYDLTVATKHKEVISPNLPIAYGLSSVDGFDGGLLPLRAYAELVRLVLPPQAVAIDGRLREWLDELPDDRWLDLFNARYVITDKVADLWREEVFFDRSHPVVLSPGAGRAKAGYLPGFESTGLWLIGRGEPGLVSVTAAGGRRWRVQAEPIADGLFAAAWPQPSVITALAVEACAGCGQKWEVDGLSLLDRRDGAFHPIVLGAYRLIHSGDVKIYENLDALPRAFLVGEWAQAGDAEAALTAMASSAFEPARQAVVQGDVATGGRRGATPGMVEVVSYAPEDVRLRTTADRPALLVLSDANYPGWQATVDGRAAPILRADVLFRAVFVPAGEHEVVFTFRPPSVAAGLVASVLGLICLAILLAAPGRLRRGGRR